MATIKTFEEIMESMLAAIDADFDTREGAIIYDALAPAAAELAELYIDLQNVEDLAFIDTSSGDRLRQKGSEVLGDTGLAATFAVIKGEFRDTSVALFDVPIGSRYRLGDVVYAVTTSISTGLFECTAETAGVVGNQTGSMVPVTNVAGLGTAVSLEVLILGEDAETDEEYRARYVETVVNTPKDGNIAQYKEWANEFGGIGNNKVFPLWNGPNTVKQSILDSDNGVASSTLIDDYQAYLDPTTDPGEGEGQAPIGAIVTVTTASELTVDTTATITLTSGYTIGQAITEVTGLLQDFYKNSVNYQLDQVTIIETGSVILSAVSVQSVSSGILLNGVNADLALAAEQIPIVGTVSLSE